MRGRHLTLLAGLAVLSATQAQAKSTIVFDAADGGGPAAPIAGVLQCVPFARDLSGIKLFGDAHTWWKQAEGKYARGRAPKVGAVMAIQPHGGSTLGHVAMVNRVVDARTILISHANWSAPGKIERNVSVRDVSPNNDWSQVRVWYAPIQNLGGAHWPVAGFIYNGKSGAKAERAAKLASTSDKAAAAKPGKAAGATLTKFVAPKVAKVRFGEEPTLAQGPERSGRVRATKRTPRAAAPRPAPVRVAKNDPIGAILAGQR
jgi:surface antigen